ncbi:hypothetical protein CsSME_00012988 [Camellia sinensis var. sinensis]
MQKKLGGGDAPVSGKLSPVTIWWSNITCSLSDKSSKAIGCNNGAVRIREGQIVASPRLHLSGLLEINGRPISKRSYKDICLCETRRPFFFLSVDFSRDIVSCCGTQTSGDILCGRER